MPRETSRPTLVEKAKLPPGKCAVTGDIDGPFIDCGIKYENRGYWQRLYLHAPWVEQIARQHLGMVKDTDDSEVEELKSELEALRMAFDALTDARKVAV